MLGICVQVPLERPKGLPRTSAELLRVLRDFVRRAALNYNERSEPRRRGSRSEANLSQASALRQIEVAALHYTDGLSRQMMLAEAVSQMKGASKLPPEFWQRVRMLQVPVQTSNGRAGRYIAYSFDIHGGLEPQEPMPLGGGARIRLREAEQKRLSEVPKALNDFLRGKGRRVPMEIVKGLFERLGLRTNQ